MSLVSDTHGKVIERISNIPIYYNPTETAVIILGDAGINFYLNKSDQKKKIALCKTGITFYCVRGNHEERPENLDGIESLYDENVKGEVFFEAAYPAIRYLKDGQEYEINGYKVLVLGGAYSVDKWYRLSKASNSSSWTGWFKDEQLTTEEMDHIEKICAGRSYDLILSHTCPYSWMPTDLFISVVDQSTVDNTMEYWMEEFKDKIKWKKWCFSHYHSDRLIQPNIRMFYKYLMDLEDVMGEVNDSNSDN